MGNEIMCLLRPEDRLMKGRNFPGHFFFRLWECRNMRRTRILLRSCGRCFPSSSLPFLPGVFCLFFLWLPIRTKGVTVKGQMSSKGRDLTNNFEETIIWETIHMVNNHTAKI